MNYPPGLMAGLCHASQELDRSDRLKHGGGIIKDLMARTWTWKGCHRRSLSGRSGSVRVNGFWGRRQRPAGGAVRRFVEFITVNVRNPNTRAVYARAVGDFFARLDERSVSLERVALLPSMPSMEGGRS